MYYTILITIMASAPLAFTMSAPQNPHTSSTTNVSDKGNVFDYVIVGGGTAGLTIASRLVQGSSLTVAVIEAGGSYEKDNGIFSTTPGYCVVGAGTDTSSYNPLVDWGIATEPQKVLALCQSFIRCSLIFPIGC